MSARFLPYRSPSTPNTNPPSGLVAKPTAYVMSEKRTPLRGSAAGKKTRSKTSAAADAKTKKSYHSTIEPIEQETSSRRVSEGASVAASGSVRAREVVELGVRQLDRQGAEVLLEMRQR